MGISFGSQVLPHSLETCSSKFRKLVGTEVRTETMERELDRVLRLDLFYFMNSFTQSDPRFMSERKSTRFQMQRRSCFPPIKLSRARKRHSRRREPS